jgi:uncharacterized protein (DUF305 family)
MNTVSILAVAAFATFASSAAFAQSGSMPSQGTLPTACQSASADMKGMDMKGMDMSGMQQGMDDAHKAYMQAMMGMHQPMMTGIMAKDADVAFVCGMIPHHQGAVDMAKVQLKYGNDPQARKMAEKTIREQEQEIKAMTSWLEKHAKK